MPNEANRALVDLNLTWLRQALILIEGLDDRTFATPPPGLSPHRVGAHLRHIVEFYDCFFEGLPSARVDYDQRKRDKSVEKIRGKAIAKVRSIIRCFEEARLLEDARLSVHMEDANSATWLQSSIGRELQALSSHTIHHFALIAVTLRVHGVEVHPDFGMSPSTLRYRDAKFRDAAA
jgi:hypothetical protein